MKRILSIILVLVCLLFLTPMNNVLAVSQESVIDLEQADQEKMDEVIQKVLKRSKVPGVSIVMVNGEQTKYYNCGKADLKNQIPTSEYTYYELGSMSKAYTGLAVLLLEEENRLSMEDSISKYFPWFHVYYEGKYNGEFFNDEVNLTIKDLLYHTSGLPFNTIGTLPEGTSDDMLELTVKKLSGTSLDFYPGERFQYATLNYDILGLIIQQVTGMSYEEYIKEYILKPLDLHNTYLFQQDVLAAGQLAKGYKNEFLQAIQYNPPTYRGNTPAGYIYANSREMERWMRIQLGLADIPEAYRKIIQKSHQGNVMVAPYGDYHYGVGWYIDLKGKEIRHGGENPTYSSMLILRPDLNFGICILSNMNSNAADYLADNLLNILQDKSVSRYTSASFKTLDTIFTMVGILSMLVIIIYVILIVMVVVQIIKKRRTKGSKDELYEKVQLLIILPITCFFGFCIYYLPNIIFQRIQWNAVNVWGSCTIMYGSILCFAAFVVFFSYVLLSYNFPNKNKKNYFAVVPLSIMNGISSALIIFTINESLNRNLEYSKELIVYFLFAITFFVYTIKLYQGKMIDIANEICYKKRMNIIANIMCSSYQSIERVGKERIFSGLNNDCNTISQIPGVIVSFCSNALTVLICMVYLCQKSVSAFLVAIIVIFVNGILSLISGKKSSVYWEKNRDIQDTFFGQMHDLVHGFKELVLYIPRRAAFWNDINDYSKLSIKVNKKASKQILLFNLFNTFIYNFIFGIIVFVFPIYNKNIKFDELRENLIIIFYIIGPFQALVTSIPQFFQLNINLKRIALLNSELSASKEPIEEKAESVTPNNDIHIRFNDVKYQYIIHKNNELQLDSEFELGPISLELCSNKITFITGGNGSGKSTLGKLITGLYTPTAGRIMVNGEEADPITLNKLFSAIYSDFNLFDKWYGFDIAKDKQRMNQYIEMMKLEEKMHITEVDKIDTSNLSTGQKKRLAFVVSCLEDKPMLLFDEWAAEQDPEFRDYFYRVLLPMLKEQGKGVIVITHDDRYFPMADRLVVLERGKNMKEEME